MRLSTIFLHIFVAGHVIVTSNIYFFAGNAGRPLALALVVCPILYFSVVGLLRNRLLDGFLPIIIFTYFIVAVVIFSVRAGTDPNFNIVALFYSIPGFVVFLSFVRRGEYTRVLNVLLLYSAIYVIVYLALVAILESNLMAFPTEMLLGDSVRGERVVSAGFMSYFVFLFCLASLRRKFSFRVLLLFALAGVAMWLTGSRTFTAIALISSAIFLAFGRTGLNSLRHIAFWLFAIIGLVMAYGIIDSGFNPFGIETTDGSTIARRFSYDIMRDNIQQFPIVGTGLPSNTYTSGVTDLLYYLGRTAVDGDVDTGGVSFTDLGMIGIWFHFGLIGVSLYVLSVVISCFQRYKPADMNINDPRMTALLIICASVGLYCSISPQVWTGSGGIFFSVALSVWLADILKSFGSAQRRVFFKRKPYPTRESPIPDA